MSIEDNINQSVLKIESNLNAAAFKEALEWSDSLIKHFELNKQNLLNAIFDCYKFDSINRIKAGARVKCKSHYAKIDYGDGTIVQSHFIFDKADIYYERPIFLGYAVDLDNPEMPRGMNFYNLTTATNEIINEIQLLQNES